MMKNTLINSHLLIKLVLNWQVIAVKQSKVYPMRPLKFKQIRKSIIAQQDAETSNLSPVRTPLKRKLFDPSEGEGDLSFRSIKHSYVSPVRAPENNNKQRIINVNNRFGIQQNTERYTLSPLSKKKNLEFSKGAPYFDSNKKKINCTKNISQFNSEQKGTQGNSIYLNSGSKKVQNSSNHLVFNQRNVMTSRNNLEMSNRNDIPSPLHETTKVGNPGSLSKKNSSGMLFKTALETSNRKKTSRNEPGSDRTDNRQNSIGKLKDKLFGMKKIISQKENMNCPQVLNGEQNKSSFSIYTKKYVPFEKNLSKKNSIIEKRDQCTNIKNVNQPEKDYLKGSYNRFKNVEEKKDSIFSKVLMSINDSRVESVNGSMADSRDSVFDMSPHL